MSPRRAAALALTTCLLACSPSTLTAKAPATKAELQEMYQAHLKKLGYASTLDAGGDVNFKLGKWSYILLVDPRDSMFFQVALPNIWPVQSPEERLRALVAVNHANHHTKVAKLQLTGSDNVWVTVEAFVKDPRDFVPTFKRSLLALESGMATFVARMKAK